MISKGKDNELYVPIRVEGGGMIGDGMKVVRPADEDYEMYFEKYQRDQKLEEQFQKEISKYMKKNIG
ncbi:MAG: hypothetical protein WC570_00125 [Patescibacteria group bacterium]